jgi:hypothetical protein
MDWTSGVQLATGALVTCRMFTPSEVNTFMNVVASEARQIEHAVHQLKVISLCCCVVNKYQN